jgi:phospholipid/cholesterol/gamma-HCH transport system substrate-binding protein
MLRSRTVREGLVGLFALGGLVLFGLITIWLRGGAFGKKTYTINVKFSDVSGLQIGAPVRYRGVAVGKIAALQPGTNGVDALLEISSPELVLPRDVTITTSRAGLIGETSLDIIPNSELSPQAATMNPLSPDCDSNLIICNNAQMSGETSGDLIATFNRLAKIYSDPKLMNNFNKAAENTSLASNKIAQLSEEFILLSKTARTDVSLVTKNVSETSRSINKTANTASELLGNINGLVIDNRDQVKQGISKLSKTLDGLDRLVNENRANIKKTIVSIDTTSDDLKVLIGELKITTKKVNSTLNAANTEEIMKNLQTVMVNAAKTSDNIRNISQNFSDPSTILKLQQTLDSARVTFQNTQKITSDVDELIGDPQLRNNLRRLINGLSVLVSSSEELQQQVQTAQVLDSIKNNSVPPVNFNGNPIPVKTPLIIGADLDFPLLGETGDGRDLIPPNPP